LRTPLLTLVNQNLKNNSDTSFTDDEMKELMDRIAIFEDLMKSDDGKKSRISKKIDENMLVYDNFYKRAIIDILEKRKTEALDSAKVHSDLD
jgi:hypothetical protein